MNEQNAIVIGGATKKSLFFGSSTAEIVSEANTTGGWNGDYAITAVSNTSWYIRGGVSTSKATSGIFHFDDFGPSRNDMNHRTILSGY